MHFDYSYRAFLITCLLFGILFLAFKSINLSKYEIIKEDSFDVDYTSEELEVEEDYLASTPTSFKVQTNRAYNEAEKFISEIENENKEITESSEGRQESLASSTEVSDLNNENGEFKIKKTPPKKETSFSNGSDANKNVSVSNSKKNSTVSYRLVNRKALDLPNPVYTCESAGTIVINIEVSDMGKVIKTLFNEASSSTSNQCLIDAALDYAKNAYFTTDSSRTKQLGSITYNFPGQQ
jgi:hypothetical protein